jgi:hypothetical protein
VRALAALRAQLGYDESMIGPDQVVNGVTMGLIMVLVGLIPGLYQAIEDGIVRCASLLAIRSAFFTRSREFKQPRWFAAVGLILILVTLFAYVSR